MREQIRLKLKTIEDRYDVRILMACEAGSRAWGLASPDSDYDVRFIYVRPGEEYLRLDAPRDVIELPIENGLDINGWDIKKALCQIYRSNPTLYEWFSSPVSYLDTPSAIDMRSVMKAHFSAKKSLFHYISMAQSTYNGFLCGDTVRAKKYFYALRPVLACRWILDTGSPPPVPFAVLAEAELPRELMPEVGRLLDIKINSPEIKTIPKIDALDRYLTESFADIREKAANILERTDSDMSRLNELLLSVLKNAS